VAFEAVSLAAAKAALQEHHAELAALPGLLAPLAPSRSGIAANLGQCNLISGVVNAAA
jgi:hypothetical protein